MLVLNVLRGLNRTMSSAATVIAMSPVLPNFTATRFALLKEEMHLSVAAKAEAASALLSSAAKPPACSGGACRAAGPSASSNTSKPQKKWKKKGAGGSYTNNLGRCACSSRLASS
uniref:Uncharacterized protein n=1 Tax=Arundo donax TaxID=35708 RepID=A0A0A9EX74_ARUDO